MNKNCYDEDGLQMTSLKILRQIFHVERSFPHINDRKMTRFDFRANSTLISPFFRLS